MRYAWNPDAISSSQTSEYMKDWADSIFGNEHSAEINPTTVPSSVLNKDPKLKYNIFFPSLVPRQYCLLLERIIVNPNERYPGYLGAPERNNQTF